jgi:hypothetical protein
MLCDGQTVPEEPAKIDCFWIFAGAKSPPKRTEGLENQEQSTN